MGWVLTASEEPVIRITTDNRIEWNGATHRMLRYPETVNVYRDSGVFAVCGGGQQYQVIVTDEQQYSIACEAALEEMGANNLDDEHSATPTAFDVTAENPPHTYIDGGVWAPLPT